MKYLNAVQRLGATTELIFVLNDFSPSMAATDYHPSRKAGAIEANRRLIEAKAQSFPDDQLGIIVFSGEAAILHKPVPVGSGSQSLCDSLRKNVSLGGGTNFVSALELAERCLLGDQVHESPQGVFGRFLSELFIEPEADTSQRTRTRNVDGNITRRIIMLTDGEHNGGGDPVKISGRLKNAGVIVECVGIAGSPGQVDEKRLKRIASQDENGHPRYCFVGDTTQLIKKYESMANQIRPV